MQQSKEKLLGTAPLGKLVFQLALPGILAQLINVLYNIIDRMYIGHMEEVGATALTALGVCMPILVLVSAFSAFAGMGGAPLAAIAFEILKWFSFAAAPALASLVNRSIGLKLSA